MCLDYAKRIHLEEDLTVYKFAFVYDNKIVPIFGDGEFEFNKLEVAKCNDLSIENYHFIEIDGHKVNCSTVDEETFFIYDGMFHSFKYFGECENILEHYYPKYKERQISIIECVIPKDSIIFEGTFHPTEKLTSYASNKIIYKRKIK